MSVVGQNSVLNQYVPTFWIREISAGQTLSYDPIRKAFVNVFPNTVSNTLPVTDGGTGRVFFPENQLIFGNGELPLETSPTLVFVPNGTTGGMLLLGGANGASLEANPAGVTLSSSAHDYNIILTPNGSGSLIIGTIGGGVLQSAVSEPLSVIGNTTLTLTASAGSLYLSLPTGINNKLSITGPTAADYATGLSANDLVNKLYVDNAIMTGASEGAVKSLQALVLLNVDGETTIGIHIPTGSTVLSVKVVVNITDPTARLSVGTIADGIDAFMHISENDPQTPGIYEAETFFTIGQSEEVIATVSNSSMTGNGYCHVIFSYQVPQ